MSQKDNFFNTDNNKQNKAEEDIIDNPNFNLNRKQNSFESDNLEGSNFVNNSEKNNHELVNQFIKIIDIDDLSPEDILRIIVAVGSKNMAYYLALIVNFENRSRKIFPLGITKIISSKSVNSPPNSNPIKTSFTADPMTKNKDLNKV
jgi:hypothetical protein